ncbi:hypothetical protein N483_03755 [Pseudoalteromonas luteoviolacea NCIMB 1944]|nr:hypothetical protein N483_03755 [Pseudoalteromonas luteoviolacea NCIMB 1944]
MNLTRMAGLYTSHFYYVRVSQAGPSIFFAYFVDMLGVIKNQFDFNTFQASRVTWTWLLFKLSSLFRLLFLNSD